MSNDTQEPFKLGEFLVDLIKNQDHVAHKWLEILIAIEAGLAVALGFLLRPVDGMNPQQQVVQQQVLSHAALYLIPTIGIVIALALTWIIVRERKWQSWYVARFNALSRFEGRVFPKGKGDTNQPVDSQPAGRISLIVMVLAALISLAWVAVLWTIRAG